MSIKRESLNTTLNKKKPNPLSENLLLFQEMFSVQNAVRVSLHPAVARDPRGPI
jgi:hypothetical protein